MATRDTTSLPLTNDFKLAGNADQCLRLIGQHFNKTANIALAVAQDEMPEAFCEATLTQVRNRISELLTELDAWRALP